VYFKDSRIARAILNERNPKQQKYLTRNLRALMQQNGVVSQSIVKKGSLEKVYSHCFVDQFLLHYHAATQLAFSALTLLVGCQVEHVTCEN